MKQVTHHVMSVHYGKFYLVLTFMKNLQFRFYKKIRMVLVAVQVPTKKNLEFGLGLIFSNKLCFWFWESNLVMD
jgi:hypothetical protein